MQVKTIDEKAAKQELKSCSKVLQDYVKALERSVEGWKNVTELATKKIKELSKEIQKAKEEATPLNGKLQYVIEENNEHEGETFGYIMELTDAEYALINQYILTEEQQTKRYEEDEEYFDNSFTISQCNYDDKEVKTINKHNGHSYMPRLAYYEFERDLLSHYDEYQQQVLNDSDYKSDEERQDDINTFITDLFYKGNGLKKVKNFK